jgi:beta-phosphoglucomutase-like phosphatase (HAD superfamily)
MSPFDAVIFDLDGVVTDTAEIHAAAWEEMFDSVLRDPRVPALARQKPFTDTDYRRYVDGRPREEGIRAFLASRGIDIPPGEAADRSGAWSAAGLSALKNELFNGRLQRTGVRVFPGTSSLLERLHAGGVPVVLATSSRNAGPSWPGQG